MCSSDLWLRFACVVVPGCIGSNVVAVDARDVATPPSALVFEPWSAPTLAGFYESTEVTGEAAVSLRRVYYVFVADGTYTAAALLEQDGALAFQTLSGSWRAQDGGLVLDDRPPVPCERAPGHVRLVATTGTLVLREGKLP